MYLEYWKLKEMPFENTPDPRFLYLSPQHKEGLMRLVYVIKAQKGAGLLTGMYGCGKTVLVKELLNQLEKDKYLIVYINNPMLTMAELMISIGKELGISDFSSSPSSPILMNLVYDSIKNKLLEYAHLAKEVVIIIDEAHLVTNRWILESIRLLLNFQFREKFLLTLLLVGQQELRVTIDENQSLAQRISIGYHLGPLPREEMDKYILHRLEVAQHAQPIFTDKAIDVIYAHAGGIPRAINRLCDMCLFTGWVKNTQNVDQATAQEAIETLGI